MSTVYATYTGFIGMADRPAVQLEEGTAYDLDDPIVQAHPALFTARAPGTADAPAEPAAQQEPPQEEPAAEEEPAATPTRPLTSANTPRPTSKRRTTK